jgi:Rrf2 family protein
MFSKTCEYGIKAAVLIAQKSLKEERISLKAIASTIDSPEPFTAKVLQQLARKGIIESVKGPRGGFEISIDRLEKIKLVEIVTILDGDKIFKGCGLGLKECNADKPCPLHDKFLVVREGLRDVLENTSLYELAKGLDVGLTFLNR